MTTCFPTKNHNWGNWLSTKSWVFSLWERIAEKNSELICKPRDGNNKVVVLVAREICSREKTPQQQQTLFKATKTEFLWDPTEAKLMDGWCGFFSPPLRNNSIILLTCWDWRNFSLLNEISRCSCCFFFFCRAQEKQSSTQPQSRREPSHVQLRSIALSRRTNDDPTAGTAAAAKPKREAAKMPRNGTKDLLWFQNRDSRAKSESQPIAKESHVSDLTVVAVVATLWR